MFKELKNGIKILKKKINFYNCDLLNHRNLYSILERVRPDAIVHYAEQPSAPYSMHSREAAVFTQYNNDRKFKFAFWNQEVLS